MTIHKCEILSGTFYGTIALQDIISHSVNMALADEKVSQGGLILRDIAVRRVAHEHDLRPSEVEIQTWDQQHVLSPRPGHEPDDVWDVEMSWLVWCALCGDQVAFSNPGTLCRTCHDDAYEQELADQENDDRAIGMRP